MKELATQFIGKGEVKGFEFTQLKAGNAYLYRVTNGHSTWYEVFKRKINKWNQVSYPRAKSFGIWAKSTACLGRATEYHQMYEVS
jgi:hypothetical protein